MARLLDALLQETLPHAASAACGCDECLRARRTHHGATEQNAALLQSFIARRLRAQPPNGPRELARLAEDARRYARALGRLHGTPIRALTSIGMERPLDAYQVEC